MSLSVGVQMDSVSILLLECLCFMSVRKKGRGNRCLHVRYVQSRKKSFRLKPLEREGQWKNERRELQVCMAAGKKYITTLRASQW